MKKHKLCLECIEFTENRCGGRPASMMAPNKLPCKNYEFDSSQASDRDIEPGDAPPSLKIRAPVASKRLIPENDLPTSKVKSANFERLAIKRLTMLLDGFRVLGNLSNKANYEWTQEQVDVMVSRIRNAADELEKRFRK